MTSDSTHLLAIAVGNTRTRMGLFIDGDLSSTRTIASDDAAAAAQAAAEWTAERHGLPVVMSSVNAPRAEAIARAIEDAGHGPVLRIGKDVLVPMNHALDDATTLGQDRILCAFAAWRRAKQACIVVDAGTAITVDFVDGEGTFQGGAIAPGVNMMLRSMHAGTAALPALTYTPPDPAQGAFGKDTTHAMHLGVTAAAVGMVHHLINAYAEAYEAYPQIIATGGDAAALFERDELVEHVVPDLQLIGILEACKAHDEVQDEEDAVND
ncbi:MAG: type III pantothenate kinase [Phycisphaerae bacterium]|jgi:type III pantothenate kinase